MPSKRFGSKRRHRPRRRFSKRNHPTIKNVDRKVHRIQKMIELKWADGYLTSTQPNSTGSAFLMNSLAEGTDIDQRIGKQVTMTSLQLRWTTITPVTPTGVTGVGTTYRFIVFWDKQANSAAPPFTSPAGITDGLLDNSLITDLTLSPFYHPCQKRFKVLMDRRWCDNPHCLAGGLSTTPIPIQHTQTHFIKLGRTVLFNDITANIGAITSNSLYILFFSNQGGAGAALPVMTFSSRVYYKDA